MAFRNFLDGAASFGAALVTSGVCFLPAWFTVMAVRATIAPVWAYLAAGGLAIIGVILTLAFLRKGIAGIAPTRQRRR
ncbi:hypothetical protein AL073_05655 [Loktanella sp. 1ANDIMAR09]|uniref:Mercuric ion transport protein n=1 Tax=Yoonia rosea TaxID=287098 RepID=A0A1R3WT19_9RHOB|nr:hypothetical protein AL073_05655 [Loktanella sp. 1ANDIMAR09]SIT80733.1 hypothetical protein SAMN05421665_1153 [Yoonia rosea]